MAEPGKKYSHKRPAKLLGLFSTAAILSLGIVLLAKAGPQNPASHPVLVSHPVARNAANVRLPTGKLRAQAINPVLRRSFAIFRDRPNRPDARAADVSTFQALVPTIVSRWLSRQTLALGHASAHNLEVIAADGTQIAVLAGTQGACMAAATLLPHGIGGYGSVCGTATEVARKGLGFNVQTSSGTSRVVGIVPSDNTSVKVTFASGQTEKVPVVSNVFNVISNGASPINSVSFVTADGAPTSIAGAG